MRAVKWPLGNLSRAVQVFNLAKAITLALFQNREFFCTNDAKLNGQERQEVVSIDIDRSLSIIWKASRLCSCEGNACFLT